ncbi:hypothetical protein JY651_27675 [Pyxidicoccus parkwayensis]|uniref:glucan endo-1,3-beta-D-glucosidase n=1 Tax=Pyxidicoccus parkwayensis TaxID=2813578 RepID=A0ABX7NJS7_9BACT|nr:glycosyl hydrolase [Pyxidicoccus parkwaysis]QSQ19127.1 hypothetical protein JY651_27675 [Pyxidicoccus parkwaysis]
MDDRKRAPSRAHAWAEGSPVPVGAGFIQTQRSAIGNPGANAPMAGRHAVSCTEALPWPYKSNSWLSPILMADNTSSVYLGQDAEGQYQRCTMAQLPVYPHPWAVSFNASGGGNPGLLLMQETVSVVGGALIPGPAGPATNSKDHLTELIADFSAQLQVLPGFQPQAIKVHRMGDYDAELFLRAADDSARPASLPSDAQLQMGVVRGSPLLYFTAVKLPGVGFKFLAGAAGKSRGTVDAGGVKLAWCVQGTTVLFFPEGAARFQDASATEWSLTFSDATTSNFFVLGTLPEGWLDDASALTALAEAAFSYPTGSTVTYAYDSASQTVDATYTLKTDNVLGSKVGKTLHGLLPGHYLPGPMRGSPPVLQGNPSPVQNKAGKELCFVTVRGVLRVFDTASFTCRFSYPGILPWLPPLDANDQDGRAELEKWIRDVYVRRHGYDDPPYTNTNTLQGQPAYTLGKFLTRNMVAVPTIADTQQDTALAEEITRATQDALQLYFREDPTYTQREPGAAPYYAVYDSEVGSLFQYPNGQGPSVIFPSDTDVPPYDTFGAISRCNDHHFHYGYFIFAAAQIALRDPAWGADWKDAINQYVFDVANTSAINPNPIFKFPDMRCWDAYENHSYASGFSWRDILGNNEESISEDIHFWAGVILWGAATAQPEMMEHGITHYTAAVHASWVYWFDKAGIYRDVIERIAGKDWPVNWPGDGVARIFDADSRWDTFFGIHPVNGRGIDMIPLNSCSFYHAMNPDYVGGLVAAYKEFVTRYDIDPLEPQGLDTPFTEKNQWLGYLYWYGLLAKYQALVDPHAALDYFYPVAPNYDVVNGIVPNDKFTDVGDSGAFIYHLARYLQTHGTPDLSLKATDTPFFMTFVDAANKKRTYAAFNHSEAPRTLTFTDGTRLEDVPPRTLGTKVVPILP